MMKIMDFNLPGNDVKEGSRGEGGLESGALRGGTERAGRKGAVEKKGSGSKPGTPLEMKNSHGARGSAP